MSKLLNVMRSWRNWQTRKTKDLVGNSMQVQFLSTAPKITAPERVPLFLVVGDSCRARSAATTPTSAPARSDRTSMRHEPKAKYRTSMRHEPKAKYRTSMRHEPKAKYRT